MAFRFAVLALLVVSANSIPKSKSTSADAGGESADSCAEICTPGTDEADPVAGAKCNYGCICKALISGMPGLLGMVGTGQLNPLFAQGIVASGNMALFGTSPNSNAVDAICLTMSNPGGAKDLILKSMGEAASDAASSSDKKSTSTSSSKSSPAAGSEGGGSMLGAKNECLDSCFRLSAYMQSSPEGPHCTNFKVLPATKLTDPQGIVGINFEIAPGAEAATLRFKQHHELPEAWKTLGITEENRYEVAKTAKYYNDHSHGQGKSTKAEGRAMKALTPADV